MNIRASMTAVGVVVILLTTSACATKHNQEFSSIPVDDRIITATIKAHHVESQDPAIANISVETLYGVVLLSGVVKSAEEKLIAQKIAENVDGVKAVHNEIFVQP